MQLSVWETYKLVSLMEAATEVSRYNPPCVTVSAHLLSLTGCVRGSSTCPVTHACRRWSPPSFMEFSLLWFCTLGWLCSASHLHSAGEHCRLESAIASIGDLLDHHKKREMFSSLLLHNIFVFLWFKKTFSVWILRTNLSLCRCNRSKEPGAEL